MNIEDFYKRKNKLIYEEYNEITDFGDSLKVEDNKENIFMKILNFLSGKKTFIVGVCGIIYGIYIGDTQLVITALGLIGLRQAIYTK